MSAYDYNRIYKLLLTIKCFQSIINIRAACSLIIAIRLELAEIMTDKPVARLIRILLIRAVALNTGMVNAICLLWYLFLFMYYVPRCLCCLVWISPLMVLRCIQHRYHKTTSASTSLSCLTSVRAGQRGPEDGQRQSVQSKKIKCVSLLQLYLVSEYRNTRGDNICYANWGKTLGKGTYLVPCCSRK